MMMTAHDVRAAPRALPSSMMARTRATTSRMVMTRLIVNLLCGTGDGEAGRVQEGSRRWRHSHRELAGVGVGLGEVRAGRQESGAGRADSALVDEKGAGDIAERDVED